MSDDPQKPPTPPEAAAPTPPEAAAPTPPAPVAGKEKEDDEDEPDEEALLRDAVPDAESAVIGEEEAEAAPHARL